MLTKCLSIIGVIASKSCFLIIAGRGRLIGSGRPECLVAPDPLEQFPAARADDREGKKMRSILVLFVGQYFRPPPGQPFVGKGLVVFFSHEFVDMDEKEETICAVWKRHIRRKEGVVNCRKALLPVENDVFRSS